MVKANSKISSNETYGRVILVTNSNAKTNRYTYQKIKNKLNYGHKTGEKLNIGKRKVVK